MHEKSTQGNISLKNFFIRRSLRIWPLFYAMILFAFLTPYILNFLNINSSDTGYEPNWIMSLLFLENYKMMATGMLPNVSPLAVMWSLCIEEHFYLIWGILIWLIPLRKIPLLIIIAIITANLARIAYGLIGLGTADILTNIDYFAFGAIPAYILVFKPEILIKLEHLPSAIKYMVALFTILLIFGFSNFRIDWLIHITPFLHGTFFSLLILFTLPQKNNLHIGEKLWISKLGIYTYGLYLFHTIFINLFLKVNIPVIKDNWIAVLFSSLITTILASILCYHAFEKQFLKLKKYFHQTHHI
jgi:peptidoglycan/LPS O-acetylase OafA/YrhL